MSSSRASHRMADPPRRKVTLANCSSVACANRLNLAAGKPIWRPSVNSMKTIRLATHTRVATNSISLGLKFNVLLQKKGLVFINQTFNSANLDSIHTVISGKRHRTEPKLALAIARFDMNVGWLGTFIRIKMKSEPQYSQDSRHAQKYRLVLVTDGLTRLWT